MTRILVVDDHRSQTEEFGVLLLDTPSHAAANVIDGIRKIMGATTFDIGDQSLSVTFSAGIASAANIETHAELVAAADRYLYDAKHAGRNRVVVENTSISLAPSNPKAT